MSVLRMLLCRANRKVQQFLCGLHGHDALLRIEHQRISLQCSTCGYETPGWDLRQTPPKLVDLHTVRAKFARVNRDTAKRRTHRTAYRA